MRILPPPHHRPRLFGLSGGPGELLDSSWATREFGGTGLGLSITKRFVEMNGGRVWVESEVGVHLLFSVPLHLETGRAS